MIATTTTTTMKNALLIGVLAVIIGCLAETRAFVRFDQVKPSNWSVDDADLSKSAVPEQEAKAETEKPKLTRVPLEPRRPRWAIDESLATINENDGWRPGRARIAEDVAEDVAPTARPGAKRNHKKMKLAQTQARKKSKKTKRYINTAVGQLLVDNQNRTFRFGSHKDEKYYAQRKAIMDRYYARNREIARKYQQGAYTTTEGPFRYNLGFGSPRTENHWFQLKVNTQPPNATPPPRILARTASSTMSTLDAFEDRGSASEEGESNEYEEEIDEIDAVAEPESETEVLIGLATTTLKSSTTAQPKQPRINNKIQKVGKCDTPESVHMLYQNNLVLNIQKNTAVEAKIYPPTEEGSCVVCIIAEQISGEHQKIELDRTEKVANVRVQGIQNGRISIAVRFYTDRENHDRCSRFQF